MPDSNEPYSRFSREELILRDHLAIDRTVLANERTFLAYVRTALALVIVGGSFIKFFDSFVMTALGCCSIAAAALCFLVGLVRFRRMNKKLGIEQADRKSESQTK